MFKQTDDRTTKAPGVTPKLKANLLVKDSEPTRRINLSPDHLRFEFYVRYFGVEEALRMTSDDQGLAIARALIERDLEELPQGRYLPQHLGASRIKGSRGRGKAAPDDVTDEKRDSRRDGTFLAPVQHACESQTQSRKAGEPGRNLKDWKSFL